MLKLTFLLWLAGSPAAAQQVIALSKSAEQAGIKTVILLDEKPSAEAIAWPRGRGVDSPVYFDSWRDAFRTIGSGGTPEYYVLDAAELVRFANYGTVSDIRRQFMALEEPRKDHRWEGLGIGAAIGGVGVASLGVGLCGGGSDCIGPVLFGVVGGAVVGGVIGSLIGAAIPKSTK